MTGVDGNAKMHILRFTMELETNNKKDVHFKAYAGMSGLRKNPVYFAKVEKATQPFKHGNSFAAVIECVCLHKPAIHHRPHLKFIPPEFGNYAFSNNFFGQRRADVVEQVPGLGGEYYSFLIYWRKCEANSQKIW
ncbi:hypothetical protein [Planococcus shenhongbingii]|uniref:Uncharacterized protein n=1 Tax=Planococcus shenhongbingii TaxID=3058398 RepID=A0ABT8NDG3_9BACL|nr:hypothetical protein [Planococcus sp. N017]MDN7245913.1 hypothetical protein [Planococcus sp. N017]